MKVSLLIVYISVLHSVTLLCYYALESYHNFENYDLSVFYRGLVYCSLSQSRTISSQTNEYIRLLVINSKRGSLARSLVSHLNMHLENMKGLLHDDLSNNPSDHSLTDVNGNAIANSISAICSYNGTIIERLRSSISSDDALLLDYSKEDCELLAIDVLLPSHHPLITLTRRSPWLKILKHFNLVPSQLIKAYSLNLKNKYIYNFQCTAVRTSNFG
jgi:hypothetical protein